MLAAIAGFFSLFSRESEKPKEVSLSQIVSDINGENIKTIAVAGNSLEVVYQNGDKATAKKEADSSISQTLANLGGAE